MFDDQNQPTQGQAPANLPIGEPEDIFSEGGKDNSFSPDTSSNASPVPSALDAGILRPKESIEDPFIDTMPEITERERPVVQSRTLSQPLLDDQAGLPLKQRDEIYKLKEPGLSRGIMTTIIIVLVTIVLGGVGWWVYNYILFPEGLEQETENFVSKPEEEKVLPSSPESEQVQPNSPVDTVDDTVLFGEPIDSDGDGLDDTRESSIGTDPQNWDSDVDELGDGDEVIVWKTNPLDPDTDGDTFKDGLEVKGHYNPIGPGKMFQTTSTPINATASTTLRP